MGRISVVAASIGMVLALTSPAFAAGEGGLCRAEVDKLCKAVQPGEGRLLACLGQHDAELSDACGAYVNTVSQYRACLDDAVLLCPEVEPAPGRALVCLRSRVTDLSPDCKREIQKIRP